VQPRFPEGRPPPGAHGAFALAGLALAALLLLPAAAAADPSGLPADFPGSPVFSGGLGGGKDRKACAELSRHPVILVHGDREGPGGWFGEGGEGRLGSALLAAGFGPCEVWAVKVGDAGRPMRSLEELTDDVREFIHKVLAYTGAPKVQVVGRGAGAALAHITLKKYHMHRLVHAAAYLDGPFAGLARCGAEACLAGEVLCCSLSPGSAFLRRGLHPDETPGRLEAVVDQGKAGHLRYLTAGTTPLAPLAGRTPSAGGWVLDGAAALTFSGVSSRALATAPALLPVLLQHLSDPAKRCQPGDDSDGDGFCAVAQGGNDCDDTDSGIYPGATETPGDRTDQNCNGHDFDPAFTGWSCEQPLGAAREREPALVGPPQAAAAPAPAFPWLTAAALLAVGLILLGLVWRLRPRRFAEAAMLLGLAALVIAFCYPASLMPSAEVLAARFDCWGVLWGANWFSGQAPGGGWSLQTRLLAFPFGLAMNHFDSWVWAVWAWLTVPVVGIVASFNLFAVCSLILSGVFQYQLGRRMELSRAGAGLGAAVLCISAGTCSLLLEGTIYLILVGCIPLFCRCLIDLLRRGCWQNAVKLALAMALAAYSSAYLAVLCILASPFLLVHCYRRHGTDRRRLAHLGLSAVIGVVIMIPLLLLFFGQPYSASAGYMGHGELVPATTKVSAAVGSGFLADLVLPREAKFPGIIDNLYLGHVALLLGLFALIRRRHMLVWALMVLFFGLAALGPSPGLSLAAPAPTADASEWWRYLFPGKWLLGAGLWEYFRFPARMAIMAAVALGILAGAGFDGLRKLGKAGRWAALALAAALLVEALLVTGRPLPKPTQPLRLPWALEPLAADKLPGGVLHANTPLPHRAIPILGWQILHRRPITYAGHFKAAFPNELIFNQLLWQRLGHAASGGGWGISAGELLALLQATGFRYVVVHERGLNRTVLDDMNQGWKTLFSPAQAPWLMPDPVGSLKALLDREMEPVRTTPGLLTLYRIPGTDSNAAPRRLRTLTGQEVWRIWKGGALKVLREASGLSDASDDQRQNPSSHEVPSGHELSPEQRK